MKSILSLLASLFSDKTDNVTEHPAFTREEEKTWIKEGFKHGVSALPLDNLITTIKTKVSQNLHIAIEGIQAEALLLEKSIKQRWARIDYLLTNKSEVNKEQGTKINLTTSPERAEIEQKKKKLNRSIQKDESELADIRADIHANQIGKKKLKFFDTLKPTIGIIGATIVIDTPFSWEGIEMSLGVVPIVAFLMSFAMSAFIGITGHMAGASLTNRNFKMGSLWVTLGISLIATIIGMRLNIEGNLFLTGVILLILFVISILISMRYHRDKEEMDIRNEERELEDRLNEAYDERDALDRRLDELANHGKSASASYVDELVKEQQKEVEKEEKEFSKKTAQITIIRKTFTDKESEVLAKVRASYAEGQKKGKGFDGGMKAATVTLLLALTFNIGVAQTKDIGSLIDLSLSMSTEIKVDADDVYKGILDILDIDTTQHYSGGANVYLTYIGHKSIPEIWAIRLEEGQNWLFGKRSARRKEVLEFLKELRAAIDKILSIERKHRQTLIYRPLIHLLEQLDPDSDRYILSASDQIEQSNILDLAQSKYLKNPSLIDKDYDELSARLLSDQDLPDMSGIQVKLIYNVGPEKEELSYRCSRFWARLMRAHGAETSIKASFRY